MVLLSAEPRSERAGETSAQDIEIELPVTVHHVLLSMSTPVLFPCSSFASGHAPIERLPPELLYAIALYLIAGVAVSTYGSSNTDHPSHRPLGPPASLLNLLLTSRTVHAKLAPALPLLAARTFELSFDVGAIRRRLGTHRVDSGRVKQKASMTQARWETLGRIRRLEFGNSAKVHCESSVLIHDLWTVYLMLLEHDNANRAQLIKHAQLPRYLWRLIRVGYDAREAQESNSDPGAEGQGGVLPGWSAHTEENVELMSLVSWALWLTTTVGELKSRVRWFKWP